VAAPSPAAAPSPPSQPSSRKRGRPPGEAKNPKTAAQLAAARLRVAMTFVPISGGGGDGGDDGERRNPPRASRSQSPRSQGPSPGSDGERRMNPLRASRSQSPRSRETSPANSDISQKRRAAGALGNASMAKAKASSGDEADGEGQGEPPNTGPYSSRRRPRSRGDSVDGGELTAIEKR
jgi:hypothetical protein